MVTDVRHTTSYISPVIHNHAVKRKKRMGCEINLQAPNSKLSITVILNLLFGAGRFGCFLS